MKKRALMALPKLTATDEMKQIAASDLPRKEKTTYGYVREVCEYYAYLRCITQDGILKVAFFLPEHLRLNGSNPAYEVYLDKEKRQFITYNSLTQKWCESKLDRLDWKRLYWYAKTSWVSEEDMTAVQTYLGSNKKAVDAILQFQRDVVMNNSNSGTGGKLTHGIRIWNRCRSFPRTGTAGWIRLPFGKITFITTTKRAVPKQVTVPTAKRKCQSRCILITINKAAVAAADIRWYSKPMDERGICRQKNILPT